MALEGESCAHSQQEEGEEVKELVALFVAGQPRVAQAQIGGEKDYDGKRDWASN